MDKVEIERTILDGRVAERHVKFNEDGDKIVEVFAEDKRPLKLEKRIVQKHKNIVSEERTEYIKDGEIVEVEVKAVDANVKMELREHIGTADHAVTVDGQYATKQDVAAAVVAGITEFVDSMEVETVRAQSMPVMSAAEQIEQRIEKKETKSSDSSLNMIMGLLIFAQLAFGFYLFFM